jgi:hypothetical protein
VLSQPLIRQPEPIEWTYDDQAAAAAAAVVDPVADTDEAASGLH